MIFPHCEAAVVISSFMRSLFKASRTAALFVGSVVGAGFATGQEIALFFGEDGVPSLVLSALFMAFCAFIFLNMGERDPLFGPKAKVAADTVIALCSFAVYAAMIAGAEELLRAGTGVSGLSVLIAVPLMFFTGKRISWVSGLNLLAVPFMVGIIAVVGAGCSGGNGASFHPLRALAYGGMNLLFSGALMMREGETLLPKERIVAAALSGIMIFLMLFFMWRCVGSSTGTSMPFAEVAAREGLGIFASVALLLAILTTMASTAYLVTDRLSFFTNDPILSLPLVTFLGILTSSFGFAPIVRTTYPLVSALGLIATFVALFFFLFRSKEHRFDTKKKYG